MGRRGYPARLSRETRLDLYLTEPQARGLKALAVATGRSRADLVREGIEALLYSTGFKPNGATTRTHEGSHQDHE